MISTKVVGLLPEDRTQKRKIKSKQTHRKIKSKQTHRKIKSKWTTRDIVKGADQMTSSKRS